MECASQKKYVWIYRAGASFVHLASELEVHYTESYPDILTAIEFAPERHFGQIIRPDTESGFHTATGRTKPQKIRLKRPRRYPFIY